MYFISKQVNLIVSISNEYRKYELIEKRKNVLYLILTHALYRIIRDVLLWYRILTSTILEMDFKLNQNNFCIANSIIKEKYCTICYYADDTKVYHIYRKIIEDTFDALQNKFRKMKVVIGDKYIF